MKAFRRVSKLANLLFVALFLVSVPVAVASNTWYVDGVNGNDNNNCLSPQTACKTIGHAISLASSGDSVMVAPATYTENLTINISLKIIGSSAATTIVDGNQDSYPVFIISSGRVVLSKLTIRNGWADGYQGGGVANTNGATTTITNSTISGNTSDDNGGGIFNSGKLTISDSTISGNTSVESGRGGGIMNGGKLTISNSTISGNNAAEDGAGGGIMNQATLTMNNVTISGNSASYYGGIQNYGSVTLQNSIIANNSAGNCGGDTVTSEGYNLSDDNTCNFDGTGDMNNSKPKLGTLGNHGGPTQTVSELAGSPTIDAGNPNGCTDGNGHLLTTDQRGYARPGKHKTDQRCDMGAFEKQTD